MGGSSRITIGYRILLGMHKILCRGPIDAIKRIRVDESVIYSDETGVIDDQIHIDKGNLFGGKKQEGGIAGYLDVQSGSNTQEPNDYLVEQLGENIPAYRGVVGVILRQMYLGTQPYLKNWEFRATRIQTRQDGQAQWYSGKAAIGAIREPQKTPTGWTGFDANTLIIGAAMEVTGAFQFLNESWDGYIDSLRITKWVCRYTALNIDPITAPYTLVGDEHADNVVVLNNFEGADTSTPTTDDTGNGQTWYGNCSISTDEFKFGSSSGEFNPTPNTAYLEVDVDPAFGNKFTIECWGYLRSKSSATYGRVLASCGPAGVVADDCMLGVFGDYLRYAQDNSSDLFSATVLGYLDNISLDEWHHYALSRDDSGLVRMYVDFTMVVGYVSDMNPAHILRECITDPDWGMGYPSADIDSTTFETAANQLYAENFGLSFSWDQQKPINDFIVDVLEHIDAVLFVSKETGKFKLELVRDNYNETGLIILDEDNIVSVDDLKRSAFGELVNSVSVVFYNAELAKQDSVTVQDIALIQQQGGVIETTIQYPGIRNPELAARVAERELKALSTPLVSCTVTTDRTAASLEIGNAFILNWPDYQLDSVVMRVSGVAYGDGRTNQIKLTVVQDIFDTSDTAVIAQPTTQAPNLDYVPIAASPRIALETPYYMLVQSLGEAETNSILSNNASAGYLTSAGGRGNSGQVNAELWSDAGGGYEEQQTFDFCPWAIPAPDSSGYLLDRTTETVFIQSGGDISDIETPTFCLMGDEIMRVDSIYDGSDGVWEMTVGRGCLDTIPQEHTIDSAGQYIYFLEELAGLDLNEYNSGETVTARILSATLSDVLLLSEAPGDSITFAARAIKPYPPGNVKINGDRFPDTIGQEFIALTWAHRDRTQQTSSTIYDHTEGDIGPETSQTYNIRFYGELGTLLKTVNTTDTSYTWESEPTDSGFRSSNTDYTYEEECLEDDPEILLMLDETSGGTATDTSGNGRDCTYNASATLNQAPLITGGKSIYITSDNDSAIKGTDDIPAETALSISFFVRVDPSSTRDDEISIMSKSGGGYSVWAINLRSDGKLDIFLYSQNGLTDRLQHTTTGTIDDGQVHHIAVAWQRDASTNYEMSVYFDSVLDSTSSAWNFSLWAGLAGYGLWCGYDFYQQSEVLYFDGIAVFSSHLNQQRIDYLYDSRINTGSDTELVLNASVRIELESERDGHISAQIYDMTVTRV